MTVNAKGIKPEVVAAIAAAVYQMMGTELVAMKIKQPSLAWAVAGRQKNMNSH